MTTERMQCTTHCSNLGRVPYSDDFSYPWMLSWVLYVDEQEYDRECKELERASGGSKIVFAGYNVWSAYFMQGIMHFIRELSLLV